MADHMNNPHARAAQTFVKALGYDPKEVLKVKIGKRIVVTRRARLEDIPVGSPPKVGATVTTKHSYRYDENAGIA